MHKHNSRTAAPGDTSPTVTSMPTSEVRFIAGHDIDACEGCDRILKMPDLVVVLDRPLGTLYKRSAAGLFPRRLRDRHEVAVRCCDAKTYLEQESS